MSTDLVALPVAAGAAPAVRPEPLDRLPGCRDDDPFLRLAAAWLVGHPSNTATAYRRDLQAWATWCAGLGVHPFVAERHHVDAWVRHLTTTPQRRTGRPASPATVARKLSAVAGFYEYGIGAEVLAHSPVASVRRPKVSLESQTVGLTAAELRRLLTVASARSARSSALVSVLVFCGVRVSEALDANARDYSHDQGHRVLNVTRKGGNRGRVALAPPVVRALDAYLGGRTSGPLFLGRNGVTAYPYRTAYDEIMRLCRMAELPKAVVVHSLRHSFVTESLRLGAALQDVQDAVGHADPRTTRRYDRTRNTLDRSPNYLLASALTDTADN
jgi:site-specific recombinase XerD